MNSKTSGSGSVLNRAASRAYLLMNNNENDTKDGGSSGPMTSTQKRILLACLASLFCLQSLFLSVETIIPLYVQENHKELGIIHGAVIMSFVEVSGLIFSPVIGVILEKLGRKNIIVWGFAIITSGTLGLGLCDLIPWKNETKGDYLYFGAALLFRFIQGIGDQFVQTTCYSVLSSAFPETREKILGFAETSAGIGLMIGPIIGGRMNNAFGYLICYMAFSGLLFCAGIMTFCLLPSSLNAKPVVTEDEFNEAEKKAPVPIKYSMFFYNRRCFFALASTCILNFFTLFKQGFLTIVIAQRLDEGGKFGIKEDDQGLIVAIPAFFQVVGAFFVGMLVSKLPKRVWITIAFLFLTISDFLFGPSELFGLSQIIFLFYVGQAFNGLGTGMIYTPMLPEIIDSFYQKEGIIEGEDENLDAVIADKASGLYFAAFSLGVILAPATGSLVFGIF